MDLMETLKKAVRREHDKMDAVMQAQAEMAKQALADEKELEAAAIAVGRSIEGLKAGDEYGSWAVDLPVLRWYCREALKDVRGRARTMRDVYECVALVRSFIRSEREKSLADRLCRLAQDKYSELVSKGMSPEKARNAVAAPLGRRKMDRRARMMDRDSCRLTAEENKLLWRAAKEMAWPPNYRAEARAWIGRLGGVPNLPGRRDPEARGWWLVPSNQPAIGEPPQKTGG